MSRPAHSAKIWNDSWPASRSRPGGLSGWAGDGFPSERPGNHAHVLVRTCRGPYLRSRLPSPARRRLCTRITSFAEKSCVATSLGSKPHAAGIQSHWSAVLVRWGLRRRSASSGYRKGCPSRLALAGEEPEGMEDGGRVALDAVGQVSGVEEAAEGKELVQIASDLVTGPVLLVGENSKDTVAMCFDHGSDRGKVEAEERMGFREGPRLEAPKPGSGLRVGAAGQVALHRAGRVAKHQAVAGAVHGIGKWDRRIEGFHGHARNLSRDDPRPGLG